MNMKRIWWRKLPSSCAYSILLQETGDKVRDKGIIVFIAGPDPSLATNTSLHPNLEHNQVAYSILPCVLEIKHIFRHSSLQGTSILWPGRAGLLLQSSPTPVSRHYLRYRQFISKHSAAVGKTLFLIFRRFPIISRPLPMIFQNKLTSS